MRLKEVANKSSAGSARCNIHVDASERHEWEISASEICDPSFEGLNLSSLISCLLRLPTKLMNVKAQLQKLMLHKHGGLSCNKIKNPGCCGVDGKFGTAILQVPVEGGHQGGCFSVEYKGRNQVFENHASSDRNFYITTFFDCCEHFTEPVTQGYQLTLVFDLIWTNAKIRIPQDFPVFLTSLKQVKEVLKPCLIQVKQEDSLDSEDSELGDSESEEIELSAYNTHDFLYSEKELKENILFFVLHEKYDIENFAFEFLCSQDRKAAELLKSCGFLDVHLAMATPHSIQQIYDKDSVDFNSVEKLRWIDSDDVVRNLSIELKSNEQFVGRIEDRFSSSRTKLDQDKKMENRGGNTEHHGVLVIWPKHHSFQMYCRYGLQSLLIRMSKSLVSAPNWKEETRQQAKNELRQLISFCCAEPKKVWTLAGMENGELTLRLFRFCITLRAREEGIDLLKLVCSNFYEESHDIEKFEGIQTEEVAQTIAEFLCADFVRQVSDWDDVAELIKRIISSSRIFAKQLIPIVKLGKCFLDLNFKEGAIMIGEAVCSTFTNIDLLKASQSKQSHVESYMDMIVALEMNPETASRERITSFFLFFSKLQLSMQCRFVLDFETRFCSHSKKHPSCQSILYGLCQKILSITCNIYAPSVKCFAVDLVSCFLRLGNAQWLETVISNVCREPTVSESQTFILMKKDLIEKLITSPVIYQLATTSELGQSVMIPLICRSFLPLVEEKSTAMLRREVILEMVRWLIQAGDESQTHTLLQHVCVNEISGSWAHQEKQKLFRMLMSTSDIWVNLNSSSKLMVLKTCSDLVLLGISEVKQLLNSSDISSSTSLLVDCVQFFIDVEKNHFCDAENNRLITSRVLQQLMTKISTPQLMELVLNLGLTTLYSDIKQFPLCIDWYRNACQLFFQQDFVHLVNSVEDGVKKIFDCLLWLNDELCWESFKVQICKSFLSEEGNLFVQFVVSNEALQKALVEAPVGVNVFNHILDHRIEESSPKKKPPAVDWSMPQASFPAYPEVETFLRSSEESMIYSKFRGIKEARRFSKLLDKLGPKTGVSVHSSLGGLGKKAFCKIEKENSDYEIALKTFHARQSELLQVEKLRIDLQERVKSISKTEGQLPLQLPVDFSLAVLPTMPTAPITAILPMNMQNEMGIHNIKVENEMASGCLILSAESELFPSASATDVATEHIQEEKSEENHDYPPFRPPNEAPSSDSTSCGIFPNAGPPIDFQDGHTVSVGDIHQKSSSESTHSSLLESNTFQTKSEIVCCGTLSEQLHEFDSVFERVAAASNNLHLDNESGQLSKTAVCDASSIGLMSPFSNFGGGSEAFPARMLPNPDDESSPFQLDVVDTNDGPVKEVSTPEKSASSMDHVTQVLPPCEASDDQNEELADSVDSNLLIVKFDFIGMRSRRKNQVYESRSPSLAGVVGSNTTPQQQQNKQVELTVPENLSSVGATKSVEVDPDSTNGHVSALSSVDLPNAHHLYWINSSKDIALNLNQQVAIQEKILSSAASCAQHSCFSSECARDVEQSPELYQAIWKGRIISRSMGIKLNVQILDMSALSILNELNMPDTLKVVGRIQEEDVLNYVNEIRTLGSNDVVYFDFTPVSDSDQKEYSSFLHGMQQNKEFTVIEAFSKSVKDFYIAALLEDSPSDRLLNGNSTSGLLRGIVVRCNKKRTVTQAGIDDPAAPYTKLDSTSQKNALVGSKRSSRCVFLYKCAPVSQKNSPVERKELNETQLSSSAEENETGTGMVASTEKASFGSVSTNLFPAVTLPSLFPGPSQPIKRIVLCRTAQTNIFKIQNRLREFHIPVAQETTKAQSAASTSRFIRPVIEAKPPESHGSKSPQPNLSNSDGVTRLTRRRRYEEEQKLQVQMNRNQKIAKQKTAAKLTENKFPATKKIKSVVRKIPEVERGKEVRATIQSVCRLITPVTKAKLPESHGSESPQPNLSNSDGVTRPRLRRRYEEEQKFQVPLNRNHKIEISKQKVTPKLADKTFPVTNRIMSVVRKVPEVERGKEVHARNQKNPHRSVVTKKKEKTMKNETRQEKAKLSSRRSDDLFKEKDRKRKFVKENGASSIPNPTKENTRTVVENEKTLKVQTIENTPNRSQVSNKDQRAILADNLDVGQKMFHGQALVNFLDSLLPGVDTQNNDSLLNANDSQFHDNAEKPCAPKHQEINWSPGMFQWKKKKVVN